ncbi:integral membrane sensor signal transduction histidine kinase [Calothrix sp. PCC 7716]|nr:integral membrane sensor signal transduction histidine kinase [Calothrix sp. PCC 7716]
MFQATRRRLALWYTSITAVLLLLFASGVYLYVRSTLVERVDDTLNHVVEVVERALVIEQVNRQKKEYRINIEASFRNNANSVEDDRIDIEWFSPTGELLWTTFPEPINIPIHSNRNGETVRIKNSAECKVLSAECEEKSNSELRTQHSSLLLRQVTDRVEIGRQVLGYLRVSHPWFEVSKPSRQLMFDLALGTSLMVLSVAYCGWFLSGKAMEPVNESYQRLKQFTADASHELRSPIALIQTNVQVALSDLESNLQANETNGATKSHYKQQLKIIEKLTQRLGKLVNDLLFLARQDSGISKDIFSSCPLDALLMEVVEEQQLFAKDKKIALSLTLIDPPETETNPEVLDNWFALNGDWGQLARLFTNLIGNALRYTPSGGTVDVELTRIESIYRVSGLRYLTPLLKVKVNDTGIGIPTEALPKLFDRFYRADPARAHNQSEITEKATGSGLGLAIAQAIVELHQGQIQVESTVGRGTTFIVTLPIVKSHE